MPFDTTCSSDKTHFKWERYWWWGLEVTVRAKPTLPHTTYYFSLNLWYNASYISAQVINLVKVTRWTHVASLPPTAHRYHLT